MESLLNRVTLIIGIILIICCSILLVYIGWLTIFDYNPTEIISVKVENNVQNIVPIETPLRITTLNTGFGAHSEDFDYHLAGGTTTKAEDLEDVINNLSMSLDTATQSDFIFFQEVDHKSTRSQYTSQILMLTRVLSSYSYSFAQNYYVKWITFPLDAFQGTINSGMLSFAKFQVDESFRIPLELDIIWPISTISPDPCLLVQRLPTDEGKELVLVHVHFIEYPSSELSTIRAHMKVVEEFITEEYAKGNYVIVGGDFNAEILSLSSIENFRWVIDEDVPTTRDAAEAYNKEETLTSITDGFLISRNISVINVETADKEFIFSYHNPVTMTFELDYR